MNARASHPARRAMSRMPGPWVSHAACASAPDWWFADDDQAVTAARQVCRQCPVRADCLAHALGNHEPAGIWGGLTTDERAALRAGKQTAA